MLKTARSTFRRIAWLRNLASGAETFDKPGVRVESNLFHLLVGQTLERIGQHELAKVSVALERCDAFADGDELLGYDDDRRLVERFYDHGVVDTPRRARASIAQPDDRTVDEPSPFVEVVAGAFALGADPLADDQPLHDGAVAHQKRFPRVEDHEIGPPRPVEAQADGHPCE